MVKDPDYKLDILNNGLKVITTKMDYINTISIHILVKVGLWDQDIISSNKAHFIEHIIACEIIENIVAKNILLYDYNATTYNEKTEYYINCLSNNFNIVLNKILDILNKIFNNYKINNYKLARLLGFEPRTSWSVAKRSIQLSYRRDFRLKINKAVLNYIYIEVI